ncbi:hypothetical protein VE02_08010 [Pseudogymnoascus sp. 03VT05]|nr:hypothetical protein VE02_08010 [Pseudogymnoascus sp. 03VT05]
MVISVVADILNALDMSTAAIYHLWASHAHRLWDMTRSQALPWPNPYLFYPWGLRFEGKCAGSGSGVGVAGGRFGGDWMAVKWDGITAWMRYLGVIARVSVLGFPRFWVRWFCEVVIMTPSGSARCEYCYEIGIWS